MKNISLLRRFRDFENKDLAYGLALQTLGFDSATIAPKNGSAYRNTKMAILSGESFSLTTNKNTLKLLEAVASLDEDCLEKEIAAARLKDLNKIRYIPKKDFIAYNQLRNDSEVIWEKAKEENNYSLFENNLNLLISSTRDIVRTRKSSLSDYDVLLADYEPGMNQEKYDLFFNVVKEKLVPFLHQLLEKGTPVDMTFVSKNYPIEKQRQFMKILMNKMKIDARSTFLAESAHPFSSSFSINDNRITVKYHEDNLLSAIFSLIHELGHATYNHQISETYESTYFFDNMSMGMHESQSRLMENMVGRSESFWKDLYPKLKEIFPEQLNGITLDHFVRAINHVEPSLVRTEADELTYPLHVLVRYEIERGFFNGTITTNNLEKTWNDKMLEILGVIVPDAAQGVLQDIHWSDASFGYFPTYALGSAYAAQWMATMRKQINVDSLIEEDRMDLIKDWLKTNIHTHGGRKTADQLLPQVTGESFNPQYYVDYLIKKYSRLYQLK